MIDVLDRMAGDKIEFMRQAHFEVDEVDRVEAPVKVIRPSR